MIITPDTYNVVDLNKLLVEKYKELLMPVHKISMGKAVKSGAALGCS